MNNSKIPRDYDNEIKEVFEKAMDQLDPELMKDIQFVYEMNVEKSNIIDVIDSCSGTKME
jgi:hypothetical protein